MGMRREALAEIQQVALLHDIGKLAIPDAVLNKPGPLTPDEWRTMREHPTIGGRIVSAIPELMHLGPAIRAEHERWDGRGYPDGLAGRAIPAASRIVFVCDAYHAMTSDRPYRQALSNEAAIEEIRAGAGSAVLPRDRPGAAEAARRTKRWPRPARRRSRRARRATPRNAGPTASRRRTCRFPPR